MLPSMLRREVISTQAVTRFCSFACSLVGAAVLLLGFRRLEVMELHEVQLSSAVVETRVLAAAFVGLALFVGAWRKVA